MRAILEPMIATYTRISAEEHHVGARHVLPGFVKRQRGHRPARFLKPREPLELHRRMLGGELELPERHEQERHPEQRHQERQPHVPGQAAARLREHARVGVRLGQAHGHEVEGHERPRGNGEDRGVARLAVRVLDREAQRVVDAVEQEDHEERDQHRLVPHPPVAPGRLGPDRPRDEHAAAEDDRHVDRHVGAHVPGAIAAPEVPDREHAARYEAAQRHDRHRHVHVEDLLHEALIGVERRVEEDERHRHREGHGGGPGERGETLRVHVSPRAGSRRRQRREARTPHRKA